MRPLGPRTYHKHITRMKNARHVYKENEILALCRAIARARWSLNTGDYVLRESLGTGFNPPTKGFRLSSEQTEKLLTWFKRKLFLSNGKPATNAIARCFSPDHLSVVKRFREFRFVGLHLDYGYLGRLSSAKPVYRVLARNGDHFDYIPAAFNLPEVFPVQRRIRSDD